MSLTMIILTLAVIAAMIGAVMGNRAAWPLLAGVAVSAALRITETPFSLGAWWIMDLMMILGIVVLWWINIAQGRPPVKWRELAIIALFAPVWVLYLWQPPWWTPAAELLMAAQLGITLPFRRVWDAYRRRRASRASDDPGMMMAWA